MLPIPSRRAAAALIVLFLLVAGTRSLRAAEEQKRFNEAMNKLVTTGETSAARVVAPEDIINGALPGDGLAEPFVAVNLNNGNNGNEGNKAIPFPQNIKFGETTYKTAANSAKGMYCSGLILQTLVWTYENGSGTAGSLPVNTSQPEEQKAFVDRWYMASSAATDPKSDERRGIVFAAEKGGAKFAEPRFQKEGKAQDLVALIAAIDKNEADAVALIDGLHDGLHRYDLLQMWLPRNGVDATEAAHAAVYLGYSRIVLPITENGVSTNRVVFRLYYWSSHYENVARGDLGFLDDDKPLQVPDPYRDAHKKFETGRRMGVAFIDLKTKIVATDPITPEAQLRPAKELYAFGVKF